jgi:hypothetical protein
VEEAKFSSNIKYRYQGFECQFTMRADQGSAAELLDLAHKAVTWLKNHGAVPGNGNGYQAKKEPEKSPSQRLCSVCHKDDSLRLIQFTPKGSSKSIAKFKCERCNKWLPNGIGTPSEEEIPGILAAQAEQDKKLWD